MIEDRTHQTNFFETRTRDAGLNELDDHLARAHELGLERLAEVEHRLEAAVVLGRELPPLVPRMRGEDLLHGTVRVGTGPLKRAVQEVRPLDPVAERLPELRLERAEREIAVGAAVRAIADDRAGERVLPALLGACRRERGRRHHREPGQGAVEHRAVDELPKARALALAQRDEDADRAHQRPAAQVGDLPAGLDRRSVRLAGEAEDPVQAEVVQIVTGAVAGRAVLAVAGDRAVDQARVLLPEALIADAEAIEHAGAE